VNDQTKGPEREMEGMELVLADPVREALTRVRKSMEANHNILVTPAMLQRCPPMFAPAVTTVSVPSLGVKDGWVYKIPGGGKLGLSKPMLLKLAAASGVTIVSEKSGRLDDCRDPHYCRYRVVGRMTRFDGSMAEMPATKEMDLRDNSPLVHNMHKAAEKTEEWKAQDERRKPQKVDAWDRIWQTREHLESHAETKAMLRVIRAILGVKTSYSREELEKPFLVAKMVFSPPDDPEINRMIAAQQLGMTDALYGPKQGAGEIPTRPGLTGPSDPATLLEQELATMPDAEATADEDDDLTAPASDSDGKGKTIDVQAGSGDGRPEPPPVDEEFPEVPQRSTATGGKARPPASREEPKLHCECACGCKATVTQGQARATAKDHGIRLCPSCDPGNDAFDVERHHGGEG